VNFCGERYRETKKRRPTTEQKLLLLARGLATPQLLFLGIDRNDIMRVIRVLGCCLSMCHCFVNAFVPQRNPIASLSSSSVLAVVSNDDDDNNNINNNIDDDDKFGFQQRIDSIKSLIVGAVIGSVAIAVPEVVHQFIVTAPIVFGDTAITDAAVTAPIAQFEYEIDAAAVQSGLFATVYRYGVRKDSDVNPQLPRGLIGAFVVTRTISRIAVPPYCTAMPLHCGSPLGYLDWNVIAQLFVNGSESTCMYAATAIAIETCMERGWISRFPG